LISWSSEQLLHCKKAPLVTPPLSARGVVWILNGEAPDAVVIIVMMPAQVPTSTAFGGKFSFDASCGQLDGFSLRDCIL